MTERSRRVLESAISLSFFDAYACGKISEALCACDVFRFSFLGFARVSSSTYLLRELTKDLEGFGSRKIIALEVWKNVWVAAWLSRKSLADNPRSETPFKKLPIP